MEEIFTSTHWRGATGNLLINNERILYVERKQGEQAVYMVTFDDGHSLELDQGTGEAFVQQLERVQRPSLPVQYVRTERPDRHALPLKPPRRRAIS